MDFYNSDLLSWRNKKTGELVFVGHVHPKRVDSSFVEEYCILDTTGEQKEKLCEQEFREKYEKVFPDLSHILPNLLELALNDYLLRETMFKLARRLHPGGYFHVGNYVYILSEYISDYLIERGENRERPYKIISIDNVAPLVQLVTIVRSNNWEQQEDDEDHVDRKKIPLYLDKFDSNDAFTCLRRYDLPY